MLVKTADHRSSRRFHRPEERLGRMQAAARLRPPAGRRHQLGSLILRTDNRSMRGIVALLLRCCGSEPNRLDHHRRHAGGSRLDVAQRQQSCRTLCSAGIGVPRGRRAMVGFAGGHSRDPADAGPCSLRRDRGGNALGFHFGCCGSHHGDAARGAPASPGTPSVPQSRNPARRSSRRSLSLVMAPSIERTRFRVKGVEFLVPGLHPDLEGLRIITVKRSPRHGHFLGIKDVARVIDMANELKPALALFTGDLITQPGDPLEADRIAASLRLQCRYRRPRLSRQPWKSTWSAKTSRPIWQPDRVSPFLRMANRDRCAGAMVF